MAEHNDLGILGEQLAVDFLIQKGYVILERNWRFKKLEIDIIALINNTLVVVEVKTRTSSGFGLPQEFIKKSKINRLLQAINSYVLVNHRDEQIRFDIIAIINQAPNPTIEHLEDAFFHF
ncbi:YraN family protein [Flavobacterium sp. NKUCC04_CG]|uniref:YraN family protein n=1 Tax=Flavobacterium sp. NKUCC04_CG TaxID=2842121 RepID=UPI001C5AB422|nr:YraN family protein [Flavobacterium sp. NKUCC04_CG]MBW3520160.1 YraN family protein [Flavobacterium sp. NKUCC04_CG]